VLRPRPASEAWAHVPIGDEAQWQGKQAINLGIMQLPYNTVLLVQATSLQKLSHGDISDVLATALSKAVSISALLFQRRWTTVDTAGHK